MSRPPWGKGNRASGGRGELAYKCSYFYAKNESAESPKNPATAKQEPEMSRPPWGKGNRASGGRGELAYKPRLPHNQRTYPSDCNAGAKDEPSPLGEGEPRQRWKGGTCLQI